MAVAGIKNTAVQTVKLARSLPTLLRTGWRWLRPPHDDATGADASEKSAWFAPKTPINVNVTNQRVFSSFSVPLAELKHIARGNGVTLNDVVMGICSGALRHYLADLNCRPQEPLLAGVPVSLREEGNTDMNTQASMMRISLASHIKDPIERLQAIRKASAAAKALTASMKSAMPTDFPSLGAPWLLSGVASLFGRSKLANSLPPVANVAISNVPGPTMALYMAGAKMLTYYPVSIVVHSMGLNVTVQSYNGSLDFGLIACRKAMPDLPELARYMLAAHQELLKLTPAAALVPAVKTPAVVTPEKAAATLAAKVTRQPAAAKKTGVPAKSAMPRKAVAKPAAPIAVQRAGRTRKAA
jgi:WS/DGAT/MGAT family acyltransferase